MLHKFKSFVDAALEENIEVFLEEAVIKPLEQFLLELLELFLKESVEIVFGEISAEISEVIIGKLNNCMKIFSKFSEAT